MAKLKVIKKTEEVEMPNTEDKKPGVKQKAINTRGDIEIIKTIDTSGYAAGAKKFPKTTEYARGGVKEGTAKRKEVDRVIKNPIVLSYDISNPATASEKQRAMKEFGIGRYSNMGSNASEKKPNK